MKANIPENLLTNCAVYNQTCIDLLNVIKNRENLSDKERDELLAGVMKYQKMIKHKLCLLRSYK